MRAAARARTWADGARRTWARVRGADGGGTATVPHVELRTGPVVGALLLRVVLALVGAGAVAVALGSPGPRPTTVLAAALTVAAAAPAFWPRSVAAGFVVLAVGVRLLVAGPPEAWRLALLVLLVHVLLWLTAVAARTRWDTRVEVAVLRDAAPPALVAQAGAQVLALGATALAGGVAAGDVWRVGGVVAAVLVAAVVLVRPDVPWWRQALPED
ncbi:hypothetical protein GC089_17480 [Cellulomonas sp. JZ18]|uniref:hypothetical protein n=1 Tax=Cellulomonas sp. JZ18 TaxID=2654191 RepID=UPI0012D3FF95|nr:hypothetical protein [Cellulomonas sp. JZ18]QGQ20652.1 hypothetical protein GC089_17480 [Cellulomonas sp. JZ18]